MLYILNISSLAKLMDVKDCHDVLYTRAEFVSAFIYGGDKLVGQALDEVHDAAR
jgi:hypothetical protein